MKVFDPFRTKWFPSRFAVVFMLATSDPPPGSVMLSDDPFRPEMISGRTRSRISGAASLASGSIEIFRPPIAAPTPPAPHFASSSE